MMIDQYLGRSASASGDHTALVAGERRVSYTDFERQANQVAHWLIGRGIKTGDRVGVFLDNCAEAAISIFGILRTGGAFVVINPTMKADKLAYIMNDCAVRYAFMDARKKEAVAAARAVQSVEDLVLVNDPSRDWEQSVGEMPEGHPDRRRVDMDLAAIIYTSGSTGKPKGVVMTHRNMTSAAQSITQYLENTPDDIILNVLPLSFDYGLYQLLMSVKMGATLVLEKSFAYPYQIVQRIKEERVTGFPGVPTMYAMLLQMQELDPSDFDGVRYITNTGAALPPAHIARLRGLFRNAKIFSMYGVTECKRVSYMPPEHIDRKPDSVGIAIPNEEVYIVDAEGRRVGPNVVGELVVRGANVMQGYWGRPEATARVLRAGKHPWEKVLYTGDLFRMDEEGFLYFVSRRDDIIKSRGEKVSPKEVENVIYEIDGVRETAVVGIPDEILGQAIKAYVVPAPGMTIAEKDVISHCARRLENFMVPKAVEVVAELPHTSSGKIRAKGLAQQERTREHTCVRCVLSERYPGVHLDADGVCNICKRHAPEEDAAAKKEELRKRFQELADAVREQPGHHAVLAFSGGKDSSYTLWLLRKHYGLRVLAVTFDNGFMSPAAIENVRRVTESLDADSIFIKPRFDMLRGLFQSVIREDVFSMKALERASAMCNACIAFVKDTVMKTAVENRVPIMAFGWSPGQAPLASSMFRMNAPMLRRMHEARSMPLKRVAGDGLASYLLDESRLDEYEPLPYSVNPLAFHEYAEDDIKAALKEFGWRQPSETDGNSTNCLLNNLATRLHLHRHGYHPYGHEVAELVRTGAMTREEGLASLADLGGASTAKWAAERLGLDWGALDIG